MNRHIDQLAAIDLLIIDDLDLRPLAQDEPSDLYDLISRRHDRTTTIITSNRDIAVWYPMLGDDLLASSAMDRLLHHSHVIVMNVTRTETHHPDEPRNDYFAGTS